MFNSAKTRISGRYVLQEKLGEGGMGTVYRATDCLTRETIALKQVTVPAEKLQFASQASMGQSDNFCLALAQEFRTLASLRHPHIISVLDYGFDAKRQPFLTMELLENAPTLIEAGRNQPRDQQVTLLIQLLQALAYLHRRGIIHRDLKPDNVLVIEGQVKVLDFGLAVAREHLPEENRDIYGTPSYMAPEVLEGHPVSEASDLYAVGIMAYELFAGQHPFDTTNLATLMIDILETVPDTRSLDLDDQLAQILDRLMARSPAARYSDAQELIGIFAEAGKQPDLVVEIQDIRESYLQAAQFVGREAEFGQLVSALKAMLAGQGSTWLVGGESGVGKSRLLDELRTQALIEGVLVLQGQAISAGRAPYQVWREVFRRLCLVTDLSVQEAGVLKALVPDLATLLDFPIPDAPKLDPRSAYERLLAVMEAVFQRQTRPILVLLEDIHWAENKSLAVLNHLSQSIGPNPLLVVASYRTEEQVSLPEALPEMQLLKLNRLAADGITALSESMLGAPGRRPALIKLLHQETKGNVFFIVEVVRALAAEARQLDQVGRMALPDQVFVGGVQIAVKHRLSRIPLQARPLIKLAAIAGREVDVALLQAIEPNLNLEIWLTTCAEATVLEVRDERWRFAHDQLREGLLAEIPFVEQKAYHQQIAQAIEQVYLDDLAPFYPRLAHHWSKAEVVAKAIDYLELAGEQAIGNYANQEAVGFFSKALTLDDRLGNISGQLRRAHWVRQLGEAHYGVGNLAESRKHLEQALILLGHPVPTTRGGLAMSFLTQALRQTLHRLWPARFLSSSPDARDTLLEATRVCKQVGQVYYFTEELIPAINSTLYMTNLAELAGSSPELAQSYANMGISCASVPLHPLARTYSCWAQKTAQKVNEPHTQAWVLEMTGLYSLGVAQWEEVQDQLGQAAELWSSLGSCRFWEESWGLLGNATYHQGKFTHSMSLFADVYTSAHRRGDPQPEHWGLLGQVENGLRLGQKHLGDVIHLLETAEALLTKNPGRQEHIRAYGLLARACLRQGQRQLAQQAAQKAVELIIHSPFTTAYSFEGYAGPAEVYLTLLEASHNQLPTERKVLVKATRQACKALRGFARIFPIGQPRAWLWQGLYEWLSGKLGQAHKAWQKSLIHSERLEMPHEQGLAHYEIARHLPLDDKNRQMHLDNATTIFAELGAGYDLERARALVKGVFDEVA